MPSTIESLNPSPVKVGWEGSREISGTDLGEAGFVTIAGNDPRVESWTATRIVVRVTKDITATAGKKRLVVHDNNGGFGETEWPVDGLSRTGGHRAPNTAVAPSVARVRLTVL
jgi:hypothetical protein